LSEANRFDVRRIVAIVEGDPALAAEILFISNSSFFGFPARVQSLSHAVALLGTDCVRQLAMTVAMRELARGAGPFVRSCWCHSVACALIADKLAPIFGCSLEQAYTAGLLHDVGRLGFLRSYPSEISPVFAAEYEDVDQVIAEERRVMNASHGEAGAWLIEYWTLPVGLRDTCAQHHDELQETDSPILQVIKIACRLADATGYSAVRFTSQADYQETLQSVAPHVAKHALPSEEAVRTEVESRLSVFR
jgi:putative nucleotidyltransferase with HDIG domain